MIMEHRATMASALAIVCALIVPAAHAADPPPTVGALTGITPPVPPARQYNALIKNKSWLVALGKALFWDVATGSDGVACASCHFNAGADPRITIAPAQPDRVYVPVYDPSVVYGTWPWPSYPPVWQPPPPAWGLGNALLTGMAFAAVPLYKAFCRVTGYGGTTQRAAAAPDAPSAARRFDIRFNADTGRELSLRAGIDTGRVSSGLFGTPSVVYDMWGAAVNIAHQIKNGSPQPGIYVTSRVQEVLQETVEFTPAGTIAVDGATEPVWRLSESP